MVGSEKGLEALFDTNLVDWTNSLVEEGTYIITAPGWTKGSPGWHEGFTYGDWTGYSNIMSIWSGWPQEGEAFEDAPE